MVKILKTPIWTFEMKAQLFMMRLKGWKLPFKNLKKSPRREFFMFFQATNFPHGISTPIVGKVVHNFGQNFKNQEWSGVLFFTNLKTLSSDIDSHFPSHPVNLPYHPLNMVNIEKNWKRRHVACWFLLIRIRWVRILGYLFGPTSTSSPLFLNMFNIEKKIWKPDVACRFLLNRGRWTRISAHFFHSTPLTPCPLCRHLSQHL